MIALSLGQAIGIGLCLFGSIVALFGAMNEDDNGQAFGALVLLIGMALYIGAPSG